MCWQLGLRLRVDSSAAVVVASRSGLGKIRHLEVKLLWLQEAAKAKRLVVQHVKGLTNPSDLLTKPRSAAEISPLLNLVGGVSHSSAPGATVEHHVGRRGRLTSRPNRIAVFESRSANPPQRRLDSRASAAVRARLGR